MNLTIHTKDLVKSYSNRTVVSHVSVEVKQGEIVGLLGPNGAGKTTTFYMVVGLIRPDEGDVYLNDTNITKLPMYKRAQMGIGYLPQEASVFRKLSVEDNIRAVLEMTKLTKQEQKNKLEALLDEFNLHHVRKNNGDSLSGGERRRTEIARALAVDPKFILLDEPFAGVDPIAVEDIQGVVAKLKYRNIGILITDHNVNETLSICDRAYLLIGGKIFIHGTAEELAENEQVRRLYLGTNFELRRKDWILEMGRETKEEKLQRRLFNAIKDQLNEIDGILTGKYNGHVKDHLVNSGFFSRAAALYELAGEFAEKNDMPRLQEYALEYRNLELEKGTEPPFNIPGESQATTGINAVEPGKEDLLNEELLKAKTILENMRLLISNPEFSNV